MGSPLSVVAHWAHFTLRQLGRDSELGLLRGSDLQTVG